MKYGDKVIPTANPIPVKEHDHIGKVGRIVMVAEGAILVDFDDYDTDEHWYLPEHLVPDTSEAK